MRDDWIDWHAELDRELERGRRERQEATDRARQVEEARRIEAEDEEIRRLIHVDRRRGYTCLIEALAQRHRITIEWRVGMPAGTAAYADERRRKIVIPPIGVNHDDEASVAIGLHEIGHIRAGKCTRREPHRPNPKVHNWWHCLECERLAWVEALRLYPFTREMFSRLQSSLRHYRRTTPASPEATAALDRTASKLAWLEDRQRRLRWRLRVERQQTVNKSLGVSQ